MTEDTAKLGWHYPPGVSERDVSRLPRTVRRPALDQSHYGERVGGEEVVVLDDGDDGETD